MSTVDVPEQIPLQSDVRLAQKCAGAMLWMSTRSRPDLIYCVSRLASLCSKNPSSSPFVGKKHIVDSRLEHLTMVLPSSPSLPSMVPCL